METGDSIRGCLALGHATRHGQRREVIPSTQPPDMLVVLECPYMPALLSTVLGTKARMFLWTWSVPSARSAFPCNGLATSSGRDSSTVSPRKRRELGEGDQLSSK